MASRSRLASCRTALLAGDLRVRPACAARVAVLTAGGIEADLVPLE
jgi:hypothetical protein